MSDTEKLIAEYSPEYCQFLEATYTDHMLSEGGHAAVDRLFSGTNIQDKTLLDIGFGLGGTPFYLAETHQAKVTGIEINPWLAEEATRRTPAHLKPLLSFITYDNPSRLPFDDNTFDVIYSKGVLTHLKEKTVLFQDIYRTLKPGGFLLIDDWLSPIENHWGKRIQTMCEMEDLTLYAETEANYQQLLQDTGFTSIQMRDENPLYTQYNKDVVKHLKSKDYATQFINQFGEQSWQEAVAAYQLIADAITENELLIRWFKAQKP